MLSRVRPLVRQAPHARQASTRAARRPGARTPPPSSSPSSSPSPSPSSSPRPPPGSGPGPGSGAGPGGRRRWPGLRYSAKVTLYAAQVACFAHLVLAYVGEVSGTSGSSMLPTLPADGSVLVVSALAYWRPRWLGGNRRPARGDLVTFPSPSNPEYAVCKRVVGLAGDVVEVEPRRADDDPGWLAGHVVERRGQGVYIKVPKGHVWVAGDNMSNSIDSRHYGPVPIAMIRGKATYDLANGVRKLGNNITELGPSPNPWQV